MATLASVFASLLKRPEYGTDAILMARMMMGELAPYHFEYFGFVDWEGEHELRLPVDLDFAHFVATMKKMAASPGKTSGEKKRAALFSKFLASSDPIRALFLDAWTNLPKPMFGYSGPSYELDFVMDSDGNGHQLGFSESMMKAPKTEGEKADLLLAPWLVKQIQALREVQKREIQRRISLFKGKSSRDYVPGAFSGSGKKLPRGRKEDLVAKAQAGIYAAFSSRLGFRDWIAEEKPDLSRYNLEQALAALRAARDRRVAARGGLSGRVFYGAVRRQMR